MTNKRTIEGERLRISDADGTVLLTVREVLDERTALLELEGSLSLDVAHDFEDELMSVASVCSQVTVDLSGLEFISSAGLQTLLAVQQLLERRPGASFTLRGLGGAVLETFRDTGFDALFDIL